MPTGPRFQEILNAYAPIAFTRKSCHMCGPIGNSACRGRDRPFQLDQKPYGPASRIRPLKVEPNKCSDSGKKWKKGVHKKFTKNFSKRVDFLKIPAYSTIVGRTNRTPNFLLYHISQDLSIGKMHKNLPPRRAVFRIAILSHFQLHLRDHQGQDTLSLRYPQFLIIR